MSNLIHDRSSRIDASPSGWVSAPRHAPIASGSRATWLRRRATVLVLVLAGLSATAAAVLWFGARSYSATVPIGIGSGLLLSACLFYLSRTSPGLPQSLRVLTRSDLVATLEAGLAMSRTTSRAPGAFALEFDTFRQLEERLSHDARAVLLQICADRLGALLGPGDRAIRLEGPCFVVAAAPDRCAALEDAIRFAGTLQAALAAPVRLAGGNIYPSFSVGFALPDRLTDAGPLVPRTGEALIQAAMNAMTEALRSGPGAIRSFSLAMHERIQGRRRLSEEVDSAMGNGQIRPFFQPQTDTATGLLTGFEALARWHHPERGMIPPSEFLPAIEEAGLMVRLGQLMTREALSAMRHWEDTGLQVPQVGVNFSTQELSDPNLADHIAQELEIHGLAPERLTIEVLETVVAGQRDDTVARNLSRLAAMGCRLDLDDFGTGHASITSIRRFSIARIKIDRTFVSRIDEDAEQQDMVAAILTMAERLGLEALAEGVETAAELAMLRTLGCAYVQGFGIARPMALADTDGWITANGSRVDALVPLRARSA